MDGDFDVQQRSCQGCVPPLLAMARLGGCNAERESALVEQEVGVKRLISNAADRNLTRGTRNPLQDDSLGGGN